MTSTERLQIGVFASYVSRHGHAFISIYQRNGRPARDDDRRIISGIIRMLQCSACWRDCPPDYGPCTTIYNRFDRWAKRGRWQALFEELARCGKDSVSLSIDSTSIKAHRSASGGKRGESMNKRSAARAVGGPRKSTR